MILYALYNVATFVLDWDKGYKYGDSQKRQQSKDAE